MSEIKLQPRKDRGPLEFRPLSLERHVSRNAEGSALVKLGQTHVLATITVEDKIPTHMRDRRDENGKKLPPTGWLMAEYGMLPRSTSQRIARDRANLGGRTQEIQRLLGRAFRASLNLDLFPFKTLIVDCDVLQADGGTRVTSVLAGYAALWDLADMQTRNGMLDDWPLSSEIGAVSVGMVGGEMRLDLDYKEDSQAELDLNVVATSQGKIIEVQGATEREPVSQETFEQLMRLGVDGAKQLAALLKQKM